MKNTTGLYKHQRDNKGKRRKLPSATPKAKLVPVEKYEYEKARDAGLPDVELLLDNAATASQVRELLRDDDGQETAMREAVRLAVYEPLAKLLTARSENRTPDGKAVALGHLIRGIATRSFSGLCFDGCQRHGLQEHSPFCQRYRATLKELGELHE